MLVLDDADHEAGGVETVREEEECTKVGEGISAQSAVFRFGHLHRPRKSLTEVACIV